MTELTTKEEEALRRFARLIRERFAGRLGSLQLFGSKARGDATKYSDIDVLVIVDEATWRDRHAASSVSSAVLVESGIDISARVFSPQQIEQMKRRRSVFWQTVAPDLRPIEE